MYRNSHSVPAISANSRAIPPLPHPSWLYGARESGARKRPLAADEFWRRLGL